MFYFNLALARHFETEIVTVFSRRVARILLFFLLFTESKPTAFLLILAKATKLDLMWQRVYVWVLTVVGTFRRSLELGASQPGQLQTLRFELTIEVSCRDEVDCICSAQQKSNHH